MARNRLRMDDDKTEIMPVGTKAKLKSVPQTSSLTLPGSTMPFSYKVRNLGVYLESNLSMDQHVNFLCRSVFLELRRIGHLRHHLTVDATKKLVSSFVLSRLDYCNSLLAGLPENRLVSLAESTKQCSSSCPWLTRARPCKAFAQISALDASPCSD